MISYSCIDCIINLGRSNMGYTHYWKKIEELDQDKWNDFTKDVESLLEDSTTIQFEDDVPKPPKITKDYIRFNGKGEKGHETFIFDRKQAMHSWTKVEDTDGMYFNFCKTAYKPYDLYVVAVLALASLHFGDDILLSSDGSTHDLRTGHELAYGVYKGV